MRTIFARMMNAYASVNGSSSVYVVVVVGIPHSLTFYGEDSSDKKENAH